MEKKKKKNCEREREEEEEEEEDFGNFKLLHKMNWYKEMSLYTKRKCVIQIGEKERECVH